MLDRISNFDICENSGCKYYPEDCCSLCSVLMDEVRFRFPKKDKNFWREK
jgi:hypothetical protein